jgi:hypothetical protein
MLWDVDVLRRRSASGVHETQLAHTFDIIDPVVVIWRRAPLLYTPVVVLQHRALESTKEKTQLAHTFWHYLSSSCYTAQSATPLHSSSRFTAQSAGIHEREEPRKRHESRERRVKEPTRGEEATTKERTANTLPEDEARHNCPQQRP